LQYNSVTGKWENVDRTGLNLSELGDVSIVSPSNGQVLVYNSTTSKWENSSAGFVPYVGAVTTVDLGAQGLRAGYVRFNTSVVSVPEEQGIMFWDADDETIDVILNGYIMKIGEDQFYPVKNQTGSSIAKGTAVRFAGTVGASGRLLIAPFIADGSVSSSFFMGVTAEAIADGADGKVLYFGRIRGINTNAFNEGDVLYASTTVAGGFQTAVPLAPNNIVQVAAVINKSINQGVIFVRPSFGSNINQDEGVKIVSPTTGQLLQLQANGLWENKTTAQVLGGTSSQFVKGDGTLDSNTYQVTSEKGEPNGYASLDSNGKVPLVQINDALIGNVNFQGLWNASTNTPTLANPPASGTKGYYYIVSTAGTFAGISFEVGDWIISDGTAWGKVDNTDAVSSVFGRTGNVTAANGDYTTAQVTESGNLYYTDGRARGALSFVAGSGAYNSTTGVITIPTNNNQITNGAGYITSAALGAYLPLAGGNMTGPINLFASQFYESSGLFALNANNSDLIGLNALYFNDFADSPSEGINWYNTSTTWDSLWSASGVLYYTPNRTNNTSGTSYTVYHSGNLTNPVTGTGNTNYLSKFTSNGSTIGNSIVFDNGTNVGIGTATPASNAALTVIPLSTSFNIELSQTGVGALAYQIASTNNDFGAGGGKLVFTYGNDSTLSLLTLVQATAEVLIGTNTPNGNKLRVNGTIWADGTITATSLIKSGGTSSQFLKADGSVDSTSYVSNVSASSPLFSSGGATPNITIQQASGSQNGFLSSTDWTTFNSKVSSQWITTGSNIYYNTGNVGIGTATVTNSKLLIAGTHVTGNSILGVVPVGNQTATIGLYNSSVVRKGLLYSDTGFVRLETDADPLQFLSAGNFGISIFTNGRVFVGSSPSDAGFQLDVNGTGRFSGIVGINGVTEAGWGLKVYENFKVQNNNGTTVLQIADIASGGKAWSLISSGAGNVHSVPAGSFYVRNSSDGITALTLASTGAATFTSSVIASNLRVNNGAFRGGLYAYVNVIGVGADNSLTIFAEGGVNQGNIYFCPGGSSTRQMTITAGGNVLIGTTTNGASKLRIVGLPTSAAGLSSGDVYNLAGALMIA
jgi:hypothetical protein